jgi:hypothetical protein
MSPPRVIRFLVNLIARFNAAATTRLLFLAPGTPVPSPMPQPRFHAARPRRQRRRLHVAVLLGMADGCIAARDRRRSPFRGRRRLWDFGSDTDAARIALLRRAPGLGRRRFAILFDMVGDRELQIPQEGYSSPRRMCGSSLEYRRADRAWRRFAGNHGS